MQRRISRGRSERRGLAAAGASVLEMVVVVALFSVVIATLLAALDRATTTTSFAQRRNESLDDLRVMAAAFSKDVRQGVGATSASPTSFSFSTYVDGTEQALTWRAVSDAGGFRLERVVDGGVANVYVVELTTTSVFSYFGEVDPARVNRVRMALATRPDERFAAVGLTTEVEMRNVD